MAIIAKIVRAVQIVFFFLFIIFTSFLFSPYKKCFHSFYMYFFSARRSSRLRYKSIDKMYLRRYNIGTFKAEIDGALQVSNAVTTIAVEM